MTATAAGSPSFAAGRTELIPGITGQGGACAALLLLAEGYPVHGLRRSSSSFNTARIDHLYVLTDATRLIRGFQDVQPVEIHHLAAQSHAAAAWVYSEGAK